MYRVAIVDDEEVSAANLKNHLERFAAENKTEFSIDMYKNAVNFIESYRPDYDIIFMDIAMPHMDGMAAAAKLRELDSDVLLIFVTNMAQLAVRGYDVNAFGFIVKPATYESVVLKLTKAIERLKKMTDDSIVIGSKTGFKKVNTGDIKYVEIRGHTLMWHVGNEVYKTTGTLTKVRQQLGNNFALCNQCYLINLRHCDELVGSEVRVDGEALQISRYKKAEFLRKLNKYLNGSD